MELLGDPADQILALRDRLEDLYEQFRPQHQGRRLHWHIRRAMLAEPCPYADLYPNPEWPLRRLTFMLDRLGDRSEEHTSELQSLMRISYAVFCLKKKKKTPKYNYNIQAM